TAAKTRSAVRDGLDLRALQGTEANHELYPRAHVELAIDGLQVIAHGVGADEQGRTDRGDVITHQHADQHFVLPTRQALYLGASLQQIAHLTDVDDAGAQRLTLGR